MLISCVHLLQNEEEEDDFKSASLAENQETAGFYELDQRYNLGGLFNQLFFLSIQGDGKHAGKEPSGALKDAIDKHFTDYNGFKDSFKKQVEQRFLPGWVWLGYSKDNQSLVVTQTNN